MNRNKKPSDKEKHCISARPLPMLPPGACLAGHLWIISVVFFVYVCESGFQLGEYS